MGYLLGIDVGTTRTAAAVTRPGARAGDIEMVDLGDRSAAVPSVLYIGDDGSFVVGDAAERHAVSDPDHVVREFKRRIGDPTPVLVAGRPWPAEELSARLVQWVVDRVVRREGAPAARIAVTHPASWGPHKKELFGAALHRYGLPVSFLAEPQAAALHYAAAERVEPGSTIAVYDFGGGTFDAAVVHKTAQGFELLGRPEGVDRLGGIDLDEAVFEHVREGLPEAFDGLDEADPGVLSAIAALRRECREAKEALSADTEVTIPVLTPAAQGSVRLHRSEFEAMIRPSIEETVHALRRAVSTAGRTPEQLSAVLLVGGSSRIPLVAQLVSEQLGRPVAVDADPKNAIAKGAALFLAPARSTVTGAHGAVGSGPHVPAPRGAGVAVGAGAVGAGAVGAVALSGGHRVPAHAGVAHGTYGDLPAVDPTPPTQRLATSSIAGAPPPPPVRPSLPSAWDDEDYDYAPRPSRSRNARGAVLLVCAGAALAAVAVIALAFLWPRTASVATPLGAPGTPIGVDGAATIAPTSAPLTTDDAPAPTVTDAANPPTRPSRAPVVPPATSKPVVTTTTAAPTTTTKPPPTTTTKPPPTTTTPPPPVTTPAVP